MPLIIFEVEKFSYREWLMQIGMAQSARVGTIRDISYRKIL